MIDAIDRDARHQRFAADDDGRLAAFDRMLDDPSIEIAMPLRGGYGLTRLLPRLDFAKAARVVRERGLRFVGHSDFTAFELGLFATTGAVSYAGPMIGDDFGGDGIDAFTASHFWPVMRDDRVDAEFATPHADLAADGVLWGGNLAMLASLVGTPWMPGVDGGILFVEDVNEHPYRIERMLLQLHQAGILARQRLVLCGDFSGYRATPNDNGYDLTEALRHVALASGVPLVSGLPFGHCKQKLTLAVGAAARVEVAANWCRIQQRV